MWGVFSAVTSYVLFRATRRPLSCRTPRWSSLRQQLLRLLLALTRTRTSLLLQDGLQVVPAGLPRHHVHHVWLQRVLQVRRERTGPPPRSRVSLSLSRRLRAEDSMDVGVVLLFYGLYYGVMGRDFAEICSDYMASTIGVQELLIPQGEELGCVLFASYPLTLTLCGSVP